MVPHVMCHVLMSLSMSEHCHHCQEQVQLCPGKLRGTHEKYRQKMIVHVINVCCMALSLLMDDQLRGWDPEHAIFECLYHET